MSDTVFMKIQNVNAWYGPNHALKNVTINIPRNKIFAFIGPSGCGKTTMLRSINRLNDLVHGFRIEGDIHLEDQNVYEKNDKHFVEELRKNIGMVFQQPNPLPMTILQNMIMPLKEHYSYHHDELKNRAIDKLKLTGLYEEVKDRLNKTALSLSGGQQQRLCIARALMLDPQCLLFDEPCSALDPISTGIIEDLLVNLKEKYTIIIVTHNMEQARRIADHVAYFHTGEVLEYGTSEDIYVNPQNESLRKYISGEI